MKALVAVSLGLHWKSIKVMLYEVKLWLCYGCVMVMLYLLWQPGERFCYCHCASQERGCVMAAMPARRE